MTVAGSHARYPSRHASGLPILGAVLVVWVVLAAVAVTLIAPRTAAAKVDSKYAKAYARELGNCNAQHVAFRNMANAYAGGLPDALMQLDQLLELDQSDPATQQAIDDYKQWTREEYDCYMSTWSRIAAKYVRAVEKFYPRVKHMFSRPEDRIKLRRWSRKWVLGANEYERAFNHMAVSWYYLSQLDGASALAEKEAANALVEKAKPEIAKARAELAKLKR